MQLHEIKNIRPLVENISITQITPLIKRSIYDAIRMELSYVPSLRRSLLKYEDEMNAGHGKSVRQALSNMLLGRLMSTVSKNIKNTVDELLPDTLHSVHFRDIIVDGQAEGRMIIIRSDTIKQLSAAVIAQLFDVVFDSGSDYFDDLFSKDMISSTADLIKTNNLVVGLIGGIANTTTHELVHVIQYNKQKHRPSTEYRSYLGSKGEFEKLHSVMSTKSFDHSTPDYARWEYLYRASPQEIAAFAHDIANTIIQRNGIDDDYYYVDGDTMGELAPDIVRAIKQYITPTNRNEQKIFNRYVKLVYLELKNYIDQLNK